MSGYIGIKEIWQKDERTLGIKWTDNQESFYDVLDLRRLCPCALCVDEVTGKRKTGLSNIPDSVRPIKIKSMGTYALSIIFNDSHKTGIYTFDYLKILVLLL